MSQVAQPKPVMRQKNRDSTQLGQPQRKVSTIRTLPSTVAGYAATVGQRFEFFDHTGFADHLPFETIPIVRFIGTKVTDLFSSTVRY